MIKGSCPDEKRQMRPGTKVTNVDDIACPWMLTIPCTDTRKWQAAVFVLWDYIRIPDSR